MFLGLFAVNILFIAFQIRAQHLQSEQLDFAVASDWSVHFEARIVRKFYNTLWTYRHTLFPSFITIIPHSTINLKSYRFSDNRGISYSNSQDAEPQHKHRHVLYSCLKLVLSIKVWLYYSMIYQRIVVSNIVGTNTWERDSVLQRSISRYNCIMPSVIVINPSIRIHVIASEKLRICKTS